jgi:hypothetical protein
LAWQQLQTATKVTVSSYQQAWQQTFHGLYQSWRLSKDDEEHQDQDAYFYSYATDHTILFYYCDNQPQILLSSCDKTFRDWCTAQGVTLYVVNHDNEFLEHDVNTTITTTTTTTTSLKPFVLEDWQVMNTAAGPPSSPGSAAELAALRRAQVLKQTVGADVSIAVRSTANNISQQRKVWQQIPPLCVVGVDDCAAIAEYYSNRLSTVTSNGGIATSSLSSSSSSSFPTLVAPKPFVGATQQMAMVRWTATDTLEISGLLLPTCVRQMWKVLIERLEDLVDEMEDQKEKEDNDEEEEEKDHTSDAWRVEALCLAPGSIPLVRPLEDAVVGQSHLYALQEKMDLVEEPNTAVPKKTTTHTTILTTTVDTVSQIVWDSDEPNMLSYKVTPPGRGGGV